MILRMRRSRRRKTFLHVFDDITSRENILLAWKEFSKGKRSKTDVREFSFTLAKNLDEIHSVLVSGTYHHNPYEAFTINDPKQRNIHKACVRDRVVHRAVYRILYPLFDRTFIHDSYSCRMGKGTHKAMDRFRGFAWKVSKNHTKTCWVLKCDIRKFFASINHAILISLLSHRISDRRTMSLLQEIIGSFNAGVSGIGLPLGNLTSQLLANIYLHELDYFMKHELRKRYYIRYADDFVILGKDREHLQALISRIEQFLAGRLSLSLHPNKVFVHTVASGVDFLGWVHFPNHRVLRTTTKRRMLARIAKDARPEVVASYKGMLSHGNAGKLSEAISY
jgi:retron-type reverse transcriptase